MRVLWLPQVLRAAGLRVHTVSGWQSRGNDSFGPVRGITIHHTAGSRTSTDEGEIRTLLTGSESAPPPIAQLYLSRTGEWHVIASGLCYHSKVGWAGPNEGYGNDSLLGIEAQHSGGDEPWTDRQYDSYVTGVAALVRHQAPDWNVAVSRVAGHKEHQPGNKSDPTFNMDNFRTAVRTRIEEDLVALTTDDKTWITKLVQGEAAKVAARVWAYELEDPASTTTPRAKKSAGAYQRWNDLVNAAAAGRVVAALTPLITAHQDVDEQALVDALAPALATAVVAALPEDRDDITPAELQQAIVAALRELAAAPAA